MRQTPELLQEIAPRTLEHYDKRALEYWEDTRDHDVRQNISALLHHIESAAPFDLLDLGWVLEQCSELKPGRDRITVVSH